MPVMVGASAPGLPRGMPNASLKTLSTTLLLTVASEPLASVTASTIMLTMESRAACASVFAVSAADLADAASSAL